MSPTPAVTLGWVRSVPRDVRSGWGVSVIRVSGERGGVGVETRTWRDGGELARVEEEVRLEWPVGPAGEGRHEREAGCPVQVAADVVACCAPVGQWWLL